MNNVCDSSTRYADDTTHDPISRQTRCSTKSPAGNLAWPAARRSTKPISAWIQNFEWKDVTYNRNGIVEVRAGAKVLTFGKVKDVDLHLVRTLDIR